MIRSIAIWLSALIAAPKFFRRVAMLWAMWLTTVVVLRVTAPEVLATATGAGATIAVSAIGILATVVGMYLRLRQQDSE